MSINVSVDYAGIVAFIKRRYGVRVRRWRQSMTGCAWQTTYADGSCVCWLESPVPCTPLSLAVFLHEVGHHVIGFGHYKLRCEEEFAAWNWAVDAMRTLGVEADAETLERYDRSIRYAIERAQSRGLKRLPPTMIAFDAPIRLAA